MLMWLFLFDGTWCSLRRCGLMYARHELQGALTVWYFLNWSLRFSFDGQSCTLCSRSLGFNQVLSSCCVFTFWFFILSWLACCFFSYLRWYLNPFEAQLEVWVVILHDHFGLEPSSSVAFKSDDEHGRVFGTILVHWLLTLEPTHDVLKFPYPAPMRHCKNLVHPLFLLWLLSLHQPTCFVDFFRN